MKVAASSATDGSLLLAPEADRSGCLDCQANAVGWEAPAVRPRVVKYAACGSRFALALTEPLVTKATTDRCKARTEPYQGPG